MPRKHLASDLDVDGVDIVKQARGEDAGELQGKPHGDNQGQGSCRPGASVRIGWCGRHHCCGLQSWGSNSVWHEAYPHPGENILNGCKERICVHIPKLRSGLREQCWAACGGNQALSLSKKSTYCARRGMHRHGTHGRTPEHTRQHPELTGIHPAGISIFRRRTS